MISRRLLRIKIFQVLYAQFTAKEQSLSVPVTMLTHSIEKTYDLYCYLLSLPVALRHYAAGRVDLAMHKRMPTYDDLHPNLRFIDNAVTAQLEQHKALQAYVQQRGLTWANYPELIRQLYGELSSSEAYQTYMTAAKGDYRSDLALWVYFYESVLAGSELLLDILEEQNIFWNDDVELVISMIIKTLKSNSETGTHHLMNLYTDEDDRKFAFDLLTETIRRNDENQHMIDRYATNWDLERIAFADTLILSMAITEIVTFPTIPTRVSFDEYLELAKFYSTEKSSVFINGILDKIVHELTAEQRFVKAGYEDKA